MALDMGAWRLKKLKEEKFVIGPGELLKPVEFEKTEFEMEPYPMPTKEQDELFAKTLDSKVIDEVFVEDKLIDVGAPSPEEQAKMEEEWLNEQADAIAKAEDEVILAKVEEKLASKPSKKSKKNVGEQTNG